MIRIRNLEVVALAHRLAWEQGLTVDETVKLAVRKHHEALFGASREKMASEATRSA